MEYANMNMNDSDLLKPLSLEEFRSFIRGNPKAPRIPLLIHSWVNPRSFKELQEKVEEILASYPEDVQLCPFMMPSVFRDEIETAPQYSWLQIEKPAGFDALPRDERIVLPDWNNLDEVLENFPDPESECLFTWYNPPDGRYRLAKWFYCLFERHWQLRGMQNALLDYYDYPEQVHKLFSSVTKFYCRIIERAGTEQKCHGVWTSDDLGTKNGPFFSREIFLEFYKPYYRKLADAAHRNGMEFWLHTCGDIELFLPDYLEIGVDVIHPIRKFAMDGEKVVSRFGGKISFLAGLDVQQALPWGTPEEVRSELRWMVDTFLDRKQGKMIISAGNKIKKDCPLENLKTFFEESINYGAKMAEGWK